MSTSVQVQVPIDVRSVESPETGATGSYEFWEPNSGPLEEQEVFLPTGPSLQPRKCFLVAQSIKMDATCRMTLSFPKDTSRHQRSIQQGCCGRQLGSRNFPVLKP